MPAQSVHPQKIRFGTHKLTQIESYMVRRAHPRSLFIEAAGLVWGFYYLWTNDWLMALGFVLVARLFALFSVADTDPEKLAETALGRIAILHLHPINFMVQLVGTLTFIYGVWTHSTESVLTATSLILLGHVFGWTKVDARFESSGSLDPLLWD
jgi:hypothetical protein